MRVRVEVDECGEDIYVSSIDVDGECVSICDVAKSVDKFFEDLKHKEVDT